ncbi:MAG: hypothetical protein ACR2QM_00595 [Longimicrobiales bacterium]
MNVTKAGGSHWLRMLREAAAVLAAILVAFGLDAWWEGRGEREGAVAALEAVRAETEINLVELDRIVTTNRAVSEAVSRFLVTEVSELRELEEEQLPQYSTSGYEGFQPETGALTWLLASGLLRSVKDQGLRFTLAGLPQAWDEVNEDRDVSTSLQVAAFQARVRALGGEEMERRRRREVPGGLRSALVALKGSDPYVDAAASASFLIRIYVAELEALQGTLRTLLVAIDEELER